MFKLKKLKISIILGVAIVLLTTGAKCQQLPPNLKEGKPQPITLQYWKVFEESYNVSDLLSDYQKLHPYVSINYRNFTPEEYENELIRAFAEDRGPDILSIHTSSMNKYKNLITPLPAQINLQYQIEKGTIKKEIYTETRTQKTLTIKDIRNLFPEVVYNNQIIDNQIYGLPLSIDTLVLFYNRDLLNNTGIVEPPKTWDQFSEQVVKLTKADIRGEIIQSGAALGTAQNVSRYFDILSLLMMQNGTIMADQQGNVMFNQIPPNYTRSIKPALEALNFYTGFASPANQVYTWNDFMPNSLNAFMAGKTAFMFGYAYNIPTIKAQASKLSFGVAPVPQIAMPAINYANYWVETVSKKSQHQDEAWDFITFITTNADTNKKFLEKSRKPCALKSLIESQADDADLSAFGTQLLTAKSWYKGRNVQKAEEVFRQMIEQTLEGLITPDEVINFGASKVNQTL
jgi:ABC-type glycerol-3-phosphate transport system substrate-binding protein